MSAESAAATRARRRVWLAAALFALVGLALQWWRLQVLTASYDQGIFLQVLWNGLRGHPFESTLSSQLSTNVIHAGQLPAVGYQRLGQHFTPALVLWMPLVGLLGPWALPLLQVGLITAAGLVLHRLALERFRSSETPGGEIPGGEIRGGEALAAWIAISFFAANAVLGPTWGNFTDLCQLPLAFFLLLLALQRRQLLPALASAVWVALIREDTGVLLVGVALWLLVRQRQRWRLALALALLGGGWVVLVTNGLMPLFSEDNSRRFMVENFGQYIEGQERASSLEVLSQVLRQPWIVLRELLSPPGETLRYLLAQGLPLLFIPLISIDAWLLMGLPLLGLLLAQGSNNPLSINIRYTLLVVPGLFSGAVIWWSQHARRFSSQRLRRLWAAAMALSLLFTLMANPNRSLSFLIPDSVQPLVYSSPLAQWRHGQAARRAIAAIPAQASVAANTPLLPLLARREVLVRFPHSTAYGDRSGQPRPVEWIALDLNWMARYRAAFKGERREWRRLAQRLPALRQQYGVQQVVDGVVVLQRGRSDKTEALGQFKALLRNSGLAAAQPWP